MAETPQIQEGDAEKDEVAPAASAPCTEPQESVAEQEAQAEIAAPEAEEPAAETANGPDESIAAESIAAEAVSADEPPAAEEPAATAVPTPEVAAEVEPDAATETPVAEPIAAEAAPSEEPVPAEAIAETETPVVDTPVETPAVEEPAPVEAEVAPAEPAESAAPAEDFAQMLDAEGVPKAAAGNNEVNTGDKISGVIVKVGDENSFVDYGGRGEAVIRTSELKDPKGEIHFKVGDPIEAFVVSAGDEVQISRGLSRQDSQADVLYQAYKAGMPVEGLVDAVNKWGLGVIIEGDVRGFCPISQVDTKYVENAEEYRGQKLAFKIIEFRHQGRDIVVSRRALLEAELDKMAGSVRDGLKKGAQLEGKVTRLESFGAFVNLGAGIEGLVHVSEISRQRVGHPQDVLEVGQLVKVEVLRTKSLGQRRKERISLSIKVMEKDPWEEIRKQFPVGAVVEGKVDGLEDFGAFVELVEGVRGMVHVSEIADRRIGHPREVLSIDEQVKIVVLDVDIRRQRLRLSIRQVDALESKANLKEFRERQQKEQEDAQSSNVMLDALKRANLID